MHESHAAAISAGTAEYVTVRTCTVAGVSGCDSLSSVQFGMYGGMPGDTTSAASLSVTGFGSANGSVSLSGIVGAPVLRADANSQAGKRLNTNSVALQRYTYNGPAPTTRVFQGDLSYSQLVTGTYPVGVGGGINAILEVFTLPTETIDIDNNEIANFEMLFFGYSRLIGYSSLGISNYRDSTSTLTGNGTLSVVVNLNPGDAVWVKALVQTPAVNGGWVDSSHTFVTSWDNSSGLTPAAVAIPEPTTLALSLFALAAVAGLTSSRSRSIG